LFYIDCNGFQGKHGMFINGPQGACGEQGPKGYDADIPMFGNQGSQGDIGDQGDIGQQGIIGYDGFEGIRGEGPQGWQGSQGLPGNYALTMLDSPGPMGFQGAFGAQQRGFQGFQGQKGQDSVGNDGMEGFGGAQGAMGPLAQSANRGPQGPASTILGSQGPQGSSIYVPGFLTWEPISFALTTNDNALPGTANVDIVTLPVFPGYRYVVFCNASIICNTTINAQAFIKNGASQVAQTDFYADQSPKSFFTQASFVATSSSCSLQINTTFLLIAINFTVIHIRLS